MSLFLSFFWHQAKLSSISHLTILTAFLPCTTRTDTQGCSAGLADALHLLTSNSLIQKLKTQSVRFIYYTYRPQWLSQSRLNLIYLSILTLAHFSCFTRIYNNHTFTLYHITWELKKPCIISFITLHFIQPKINELIILLAWSPIQATT